MSKKEQICVCSKKAKGYFAGSLTTGIIAGSIMTIFSLAAIVVSVMDTDMSFLIIPAIFLTINAVSISKDYVKFKKSGHSTVCSWRYARLSALRSGPLY